MKWLALSIVVAALIIGGALVAKEAIAQHGINARNNVSHVSDAACGKPPCGLAPKPSG